MANYKKIFKICRVHNYYDYMLVVNSGVNMIGIHAVYSNYGHYKETEYRYHPLDCAVRRTHNSLPISDYEVDSICYMVDKMEKSVDVALVFEDELRCEDITECIRLYNLMDKNVFLQFQYRIKKERYLEIKKNLNKSTICTIGLDQEDFDEYLCFLNEVLDPNCDLLLLDFSKHQPDYITKKMDVSSKDAREVLDKHVEILKRNRIPMLIADDTKREIMQEYIDILNRNGIKPIGIDMQNCVEKSRELQRYEIDELDGKRIVQFKRRKSADKLRPWKGFLDNIVM